MTVANTEIELSVSVGAAWSTVEDATAELLVARADAIMYESKRRGDASMSLTPATPQVTDEA